MKAAHVVLLLAALTGAATCLFIRRHILVDKPLSWVNAQAFCRSFYVDLSTINTPEEFDRFTVNTGKYYYDKSWIGLSKTADASSYTQWSDGSVIETTNWQYSDLIIVKTKNCVYAFKDGWSSYNCENLLSFFCYIWEPRVIMVPEMKTWEEALEHCRTHYTDLISLSTAADLLLANKSMNSQTPSVWTGLRFLNGLWFWVNREPLGNLVTLPSCPARPFLCGALRPGTAVWENRDCMEKNYFVCYLSSMM